MNTRAARTGGWRMPWAAVLGGVLLAALVIGTAAAQTAPVPAPVQIPIGQPHRRLARAGQRRRRPR